MMQKRELGKSVKITPLVLGGNVFGWTAAFAVLDKFFDSGGDAIEDMAQLDEASA